MSEYFIEVKEVDDGRENTIRVPYPYDGASLIPVSVYSATVTLTNDQIKALPTTPVELVSAPGANKQLAFLLGIAVANTEQGAYTNINGSMFIAFDCGGYAFAIGSENDSAVSALLGSTNNNRQDYIARQAGTNADTYINQPLNFYAESVGGDLTGGHVDNTLEVTVLYTII